jgi:acyl transferase domain-containing protein
VSEQSSSDLAIAVVGLAGRFPGARSVDEYWSNLCEGVESIATLRDEELAASQVPAALRADPDYVPRSGVLNGVELFDAGFFGFGPREADLLDPQRRLLLECSWEALEHAGIDPTREKGSIGVFAGTGFNGYLLFNILASGRALTEDPFEIQIASDKDFLATHVSYKLNLRGPSVDVQSACSTSLVAIHLACQALLAGECDAALAGGVGVRVPHRAGHLYRRGSILSQDGHCRAFDERASGTVGGNGLGVVVLKRLGDAIEARDTIHAVVRGSAINNDGGLKVGFSAPSVEGQTRVIRAALEVAGVAAATVGYVEAHGTGTVLGDPIEIAALTQAFRGASPAQCALGSVKTNIGHLDAAAGVAGFIKAALTVREGLIPPSLHFERPNPHLGLEGSPFFVNTALRDWPLPGPRRAGVSSFGIGGTNAHAILEQPPSVPAAPPSRRPWTLLPLSARSASALDAAAVRLADHLKKTGGEQPLADVGYTLAVGRRAFDFRRAVVCRTADEAIASLERSDGARVVEGHARGPRSVVFVFPGQGVQHPDMGIDLYRSEPIFTRTVDACANHLRHALGLDLRELLYPSLFGRASDAGAALGQTCMAQPAVFVTSFALAQTWLALGVRPSALLGHSVGEYVAACVAGVLPLFDALDLVAARARLMQQLPAGGMLAVSIDAERAAALIRTAPGISVAAVNAPEMTVLSGSFPAIDAIEAELVRAGIASRRLHTSHAFHSSMMVPAAAALVEVARRVALRAPTLPLISNVTGTWITPEEITDPAYFGRHLVAPVLFGPGVQAILQKEPDAVFLEVGPGQTLSTLVRAARSADEGAPSPVTASSLPPPNSTRSGPSELALALARLWTSGVDVDLGSLFADEERRRVPLPTYPFERRRHWIEPGIGPSFLAAGSREAPRSAAPAIATLARTSPMRWRGTTQRWLLLGADTPMGQALEAWLIAAGAPTMSLGRRSALRRPDLQRFVAELADPPAIIVHLLALGEVEDHASTEAWSLVWLATALDARFPGHAARIGVVVDDLYAASAPDCLLPGKAALLGPCKVIPREYLGFRCTVIDVPRAAEGSRGAEQVLAELNAPEGPDVVALRGSDRWVHGIAPAVVHPRAESTAPRDGVYLIHDAFRGLGPGVATALAGWRGARLVLAEDSGTTPQESNALIASLTRVGAQVHTLPDRAPLGPTIRRVFERFGRLDGVVCTPALAEPARTLRELDAAPATPSPGARRTLEELDEIASALTGIDASFCLIGLSPSAVLGAAGACRTAIEGAGVLARIAEHNRREQTPWTVVVLDAEEADPVGFFAAVLACATTGQAIVSGRAHDHPADARAEPTPQREASSGARHPRAMSQTPYAPPQSDVERQICAIWEEMLGIESVGIHDNFVELGGHSLLGARIAAHLRDAFGVELPLPVLFSSPTVELLAVAIEDAVIAQLEEQERA